MAVYKFPIQQHISQEKTLILVDVSAVMRTNYVPLDQGNTPYPRRTLSYRVNGVEMNTSALYGLFRLFTMYGTDVDYIFCFDTPNNKLKQFDTTYKLGRAKLDNEYFDQYNAAKDILLYSGFSVGIASGYEGDHMIHLAVKQFYNHYDRIYIITNDQDLACLVSDKTIWINTLKKRHDISMENYEEILDCPYNTILLKKAMVGDKSDNIKGIKNFGNAKFKKFLEKENINIDRVRYNEKWILENSTSLKDEEIDQALHSLYLVLPKFPEGYEIQLSNYINIDLFKNYLEQYGMNSIVKVFN